MWYLYMLVGLYASVPILRRVTSDSVIETYYLKLSFVIACLFPTVLEAYEAACSMGPSPPRGKEAFQPSPWLLTGCLPASV